MTDRKQCMEDIAQRALATKCFGSTCEPGLETDGGKGRLAFPVQERAVIEVSIEPERGRVRVGVATGDRGLNDQLEDQLLASGESFAELLATELEELRSEATRFDVDHHFDRDARVFRFSSYVAYNEEELGSERVRQELALLAAAYRGVLRELLEFYLK